MTNIIITAVVVSIIWILLLSRVIKVSHINEQNLEEYLEKQHNEKIEWERKRHDEFEEQHEKEWREGRKENILKSMDALFRMFVSGYSGAGVSESQAIIKAVRDSIYFAGSVTYTGIDANFNEVMFDDNELFEHLAEKYPTLSKSFKLKDFYTKEEIKDRERGVTYREEDEEWDIVKKLAAKWR